MMDRREIMQKGALVAAGALVGGRAEAQEAASPRFFPGFKPFRVKTSGADGMGAEWVVQNPVDQSTQLSHCETASASPGATGTPGLDTLAYSPGRTIRIAPRRPATQLPSRWVSSATQPRVHRRDEAAEARITAARSGWTLRGATATASGGDEYQA